MSSREKVRVFVYGTLMTGERNHALVAESSSVGTTRTRPYYELVRFEEYPAMVRGGTTAVLGEVYDVDRFTLELIDELEGHPHYYQRGLITLERGELAQAYLLPARETAGHPRLVDGDWRKRPR